MLFSQAHGLPVLTPSGTDEIGVVRALTVDAAAGRVTHLRVRTGRRAETVLPWDAVHAVGPGAVVVGPAGAPDEVAPHHDLLGRRVLSETGDRHGTVRDVAFDPATGRIEAVRTTLGTLPAGRLVGLGDYALVVRAD